MNSYKVIYSPAARDDLFGIHDYIASQLLDPQAAAHQTDRIRTAIRSLENLPTRFFQVDWEPWHTLGMHRMPVNNYLVFYLVDESSWEVRIIRIVYGKRDLKSLLTDS